MLTECLTVTWHRCKGLGTCACKEGGEATWSKWSKTGTNLQASHPSIWMDTEIQHLNPALNNPGHTAWRTLKKQLVQPLVSAWHAALAFPTLLCFIWDISLCLTDAAHKFCVSPWSVCNALLALSCWQAHCSPFPFDSWVSSSRGDLSGGERGLDNGSVSQLRMSWPPDLNGPYSKYFVWRHSKTQTYVILHVWIFLYNIMDRITM